MNADKNTGEERTRRGNWTGTVYKHGKYWYVRWQAHGIRRAASTGIRVGQTAKDERTGRTISDRELAESAAMDRTEHLRIMHREDAVALLMRQLQTAEERLATRMNRVRHRITVGELAETFRNSPRRPDCSEAMLKFYCDEIALFASNVGADTPVDEITADVSGEYAKIVERKNANSTFNKKMNALKLVWKSCKLETGVSEEDNPWSTITRKKLSSDQHSRRALTENETEAILAKAEGPMRKLIAVCLYTGMRLGNCCTVKWDDLRENVLYVITAKRDKKVAIPFPYHPRLAEILGARSGSGFIISEIARRYTEDRQGPSNISRSIKRLFERSGVKTEFEVKGKRARSEAGCHSLRHTFATRCIAAGIPPHIVQLIVGHSTATMTEHYTHLESKDVLNAFEKVR